MLRTGAHPLSGVGQSQWLVGGCASADDGDGFTFCFRPGRMGFTSTLRASSSLPAPLDVA